jgi:DNA polymerase
MDQRSLIAELSANLAARERMDLPLALGGPAQLEALLAFLQGRPPDQGLLAVAARVEDCRRCPLAAGRGRVAPGRGPETASLMIVGQAPGAREDEPGLPSVGPAGQLLDRMLLAVGLKRGEVYLTNLVKCRPPGDRDPRPEEVAACRDHLAAQARAVGPRAILALGGPVAQSLRDSDAPLSALRGQWGEFLGLPLLPTFHPADLLREPMRKAEAYQDLKALARALAGS